MGLLTKQGDVLDRLSEKVTSDAKRAGAEAKVVTKAAISRRLVVENGEFTLANTLASQSLGLAVHKDQKKGSAATNIATQDEVERALKTALELASYGIVDPALNFVDPRLAPQAKPLPFLYDENLAHTTLDDLKGFMAEILAILTQDARIALDRFEMSVGVSRNALRNSLGVNQHEEQTMLSWSYLGMARSGDEVTGMDYTSGFSYKATGFMDQSLAEAKAFVAKVLKALNPRKCPAYKGPVLLSPRAVQEILLDNLLFHVAGRSVMDGKSRWAKSIGTEVVAPALTLSDDPHDSALAGATAFDSDGIPTSAMTIIENGVLKTHLHDCYSARKMGVVPSGAAGAPFALHIAPGQNQFDAMTRVRGELLYVDRFSGNADPLTGDFSGVVKGGRIFVNGNDAGSVTETMIAGNVFTLAREILAVAKVQENVSGQFLCPAMLVDGVSVSSGG